MYKIKDHPNLSFRLINRVTGWVTFVVASITYMLTVEPTTSLWDCGEFITTSVGLQVGHPPGAPLFMIISRLFAIFAPSPEKQALMINYMSALASGFTILFLFWSITHLARKLIVKGTEEMSLGQMIAIMGASLVGSLAYTFTDTFWFSAVEGEVYALSSLFTAAVFWAILKWENVADEPYANRWLILIAYLIGLSIGVHLLNLLAIPAIVFVYYFKKYPVITPLGVLKTGIISLVILGVVNFGVIPGVIKVAGWFELLFVNGMGAPFNTGVIVYVLLIISALIWGIRYTIKKGMPIWNTILTCFMVILIGYSSYSMIVIRSISNPPIDENSPDNVFSLLSYIERDQYGQNPLLYGQYYMAKPVAYEEGEPNYYQNHTTKEYEKVGDKTEVKYDPRFCGFFPRMYSTRPYHDQLYQRWGGQLDGPIYDVNGQQVQRPSFGNNMKFFFDYQLGYMYWRYFMWNFAGRQNDEGGMGGLMNGNWISGITPLDQLRLGNRSELTDTMKSARANNKYYMLPFILGLVGMFYQYFKGKSGKKDFSIVMLLFILTGVAIIIYLNQPPMEPRERDYAYAGSFYAFAIWIGLGVLAVWELLNKILNSKLSAIIATVVLTLAVPVNMAAQNWDDHNRSGRYATIAHAKNYLNSCDPNAILFTFGDNDTFPLWYAQEVEGVRRDIRIVNLSLLSGDWYIDQMKRKAYESPGVPISFTKDQYHVGKREQLPIQEEFKVGELKDVIEFVASELPRTKLRGDNESYDYIPTRNLIIPVDSAKVVGNGTVKPEDAGKIVKNLEVSLKGNYMFKSGLMVLDIINTNKWERPIYFGIGMGTDSYMGFEKYFQLEGAAYRLVPIETIQSEDSFMDYGRIDSDKLYDIVMNKFEWGNIKDPKVNIDYFHNNTIGVMKYRNTFLRLATQLLEEGKKDKAVAVLDKSLEELPISQVPIDNILAFYVPIYYELDQPEKGNALARAILKENIQMMRYVNSLKPAYARDGEVQQEESQSINRSMIIYKSAVQANQTELVKEIENSLNELKTTSRISRTPNYQIPDSPRVPKVQ